MVVDLNDYISKYGVHRMTYSSPTEAVAFDYFCKIGTAVMASKNKTFDCSGEEDIIRKLVKWTIVQDKAATFRYDRGWLLKGKTGVGKTMLLKIFSEFLRIGDFAFQSGGKTCPLAPKCVSALTIAGEYTADDGGYRVIEKYAKYPSLIIDDIGAESVEQSSFGNKTNAVNMILYKREENDMMTFGTTNINNFSTIPGYDDRIIRRLSELFNPYAMNNKQF